MKCHFKCRRSGGDLFLFHLLWAFVTVVTFGLAGLLFPAALAVYIIDGTEVTVVE